MNFIFKFFIVIVFIGFVCCANNSDKISKKNQVFKDTLFTSLKEIGGNTIAKIHILKDGKEYVLNDTLYQPYPSLSSEYLEIENLAHVKFSYGLGVSKEIHVYNFNLKKLLITNIVNYNTSLDTLYVSGKELNKSVFSFSDNIDSDLSEVNAKTFNFKIPLNSMEASGIADLYMYEQYIRNLFLDKKHVLLHKSASIEVWKIIDNYINFSNIQHVNSINNIAYYLEQSKAYVEAIFLLEKITELFPNRTVAYINLGDAYWGNGEQEKAKQAYKIYILQMKTKGKESKIPKQVLGRV